jgi:A/G-specific adenine glycosylase
MRESPQIQTVAPDVARIRRRLLAWYDAHGRALPWRTPVGRADPYRVWLSEVMLQQTTVAAAIPYYEAFVARWPTVRDLAEADLDAVLHAWQGLGYYARAHNLHAAARIVVRDHEGRFPDNAESLRSLPGVGEYTAAAVAAIAFSRTEAVVDSNVVRGLGRLLAADEPLDVADARIRALARELAPSRRPGDHAQAMMDLGATVCAPRAPICGVCPLSGDCAAFPTGRPESFPRRPPKALRPRRQGVVFWTLGGDGRVLLRKRPLTGLLAGLMEFPSTDWREKPWGIIEARAQAPAKAAWRLIEGTVRHSFTHFDLDLAVLSGRVDAETSLGCCSQWRWCALERLGDHALPTVMRKVARHALGHDPSAVGLGQVS